MGASIYKNKKPLLFFLVPAFAFMVVFLHYPFVMNILNSFQKIGGLAAQSDGFLDPWYANYQEMLQDKNMYTALRNTFLLMAATVVFQVGIAVCARNSGGSDPGRREVLPGGVFFPDRDLGHRARTSVQPGVPAR